MDTRKKSDVKTLNGIKFSSFLYISVEKNVSKIEQNLSK